MSTLVGAQAEMTKPKSEMNPEAIRRELIQSASIDKMMHFNFYICAQHYHPLPAMISWLKSSQTTFHTHIDRYITLFKTAFMFVLCLVHAKIKSNLLEIYPKLLTAGVYLSVFAIFAQFLVCLYIMFHMYLQLGVIFQVSCISIICYANAMMSLGYLKTETKK